MFMGRRLSQKTWEAKRAAARAKELQAYAIDRAATRGESIPTQGEILDLAKDIDELGGNKRAVEMLRRLARPRPLKVTR